MSVIVSEWQADGDGRSVDLTVSNATSVGPGDVGTVRRLQEWFVRGVGGKETQFELTLGQFGNQTTFKGTHYKLPVFVTVWYVDDVTSEHNGDLVDEDGANVDYKFTPVLLDGTPV